MNHHYQEAQRLSAESSLVNEWGLTERRIIATRANTEATLALAHEQRTANLIALLDATYANGQSVYSSLEDDVAQDIRERLGLKEVR